MTRMEQKKFIRALAKSVTQSCLDTAGRWPEDWDGHELRMLFAEKADGFSIFASRDPYYRKRVRQFRNTCAVKGI